MTSEKEECEHFEKIAKALHNIIAVMLIEKYFGERCPDFEPDCKICQRWKALDELTENPFKEDVK